MPVDSPDDGDSFLNVVSSGPVCGTLTEARKFIKENKEGIDKISLEPVKANSMGTWLSELTFENVDKI